MNDSEGKPLNALAAITVPDFGGGTAKRVLVRLDYQAVTVTYNFGSMAISGPSNNTPFWMLRRIYYPQTGHGYLCTDYSTYGMARRISMRKDMTQANGTFGDGTQIAYTTYNYTTIDPSDPYGRHQVGTLNDAPQYTQQSEWWQDKTDDNGNPTTAATVMNFSRIAGSDDNGNDTEIDKTAYPNGTEVWTTSGDDSDAAEIQGKVIETQHRATGGTVLQKIKQV